MHPKELRAFQILHEFENNQAASQRQLARKLKVSVGLTNAVMRDMHEQGLFTVAAISGNRNRYILTSAGEAEISRLKREYLKHSLYYYGITRDRIAAILTNLQDNGNRSVCFCGIGLLTEIAFICLQQTQLELVAVIEDQKRNDVYFNVPVVPIGKVLDDFFDIALITAIERADTLVKALQGNGVSMDKVHLLWN